MLILLTKSNLEIIKDNVKFDIKINLWINLFLLCMFFVLNPFPIQDKTIPLFMVGVHCLHCLHPISVHFLKALKLLPTFQSLKNTYGHLSTFSPLACHFYILGKEQNVPQELICNKCKYLVGLYHYKLMLFSWCELA